MRRRPFLRILVPYVFGIALGSAEWGAYVLFAGLLLAVPTALYSRFRGPSLHFLTPGYLLLFVYFLLGLISVKWSSPALVDNHYSHFLSSQSQEYTGVIKSVQSTETHHRLTVSIASATTDTIAYHHLTGDALLVVKKPATVMYPGDVIRFRSQLRPPKGPANPHSFDYRAYLHNRGIDYTGWVNEKALHLIHRPTYSVMRWSKRMQDACTDLLQRHIPEPSTRAVAIALVLGNKSLLTPDVRRRFSETGSMHILAISGLHVGIVFVMLHALLYFFPKYPLFWPRLKTALILVGIWGFALVTGGSPSTLRAAVMCSLIAMGLQFYRRSDIYNTLALSALGALMVTPLLLYRVGFQLSYLATLGIVFFYPHMESCLPPTTSTWQKYLRGSLLVGIAAQTFTYPFILYYFHSFSWAFLLSNLLVIPLAFLILSTGWGTIALTLLLPSLVGATALLLRGFVQFLNAALALLQQIPCLLVQNIWINPLQLIFLLLATLSVALAVHLKRRGPVLLALALLTSVHLQQYYFRTLQQKEEKLIFYASNQPYVEIWKSGALFSVQRDAPHPIPDYIHSGTLAYYGVQPHPIGPSELYSIEDDVLLSWANIKSAQTHIHWLDKNAHPPPNTTTTLVISSEVMPEPSILCKLEQADQLLLYDQMMSRSLSAQWRRIAKEKGWRFHTINQNQSITLSL